MDMLEQPPSSSLPPSAVGETTSSAPPSLSTPVTGHIQGRDISQNTDSLQPTVAKTDGIRLGKIPPSPTPPRPDRIRGRPILTASSSPSAVSSTPPPLPTSRPSPRKPVSASSATTSTASSSVSSSKPARPPGWKPPQPLGPRPTPLEPTRIYSQVRAGAAQFAGQARTAAMQAGVRVADTAEVLKGGITTVATAVGEGAQRIADGAVLVTDVATTALQEGVAAVGSAAVSVAQSVKNELQGVGVKIQERFFLGRGKAKEVYSLDEQRAVYIATGANKEAELREEAGHANTLKQKLGEGSELLSCLVSIEELTDDAQKNSIKKNIDEFRTGTSSSSHYTPRTFYTTVKADGGDASKLIEKPLQYEQNKVLAKNVLMGMAGMHQAGLVHGDLKTENINIYKNGDVYSAKVSDYGKVRALGPNATGLHTGNPRFAAPEGVLSQKGEVYSTAIVMLSMLESEVVDRTDIVENGKLKKNARWGAEKFLVENPDCPQGEVLTLRGKISIYGRRVVSAFVRQPSAASLVRAERAVHKYIDQQIDQLQGKGYDLKELEGIRTLLKSMTQSDPSKRPTMQEALQVYNNFVKTSEK